LSVAEEVLELLADPEVNSELKRLLKERNNRRNKEANPT